MGTNYYHRTNICGPTGRWWWRRPGCGRYDETHICKSHLSFEAVLDIDIDIAYLANTVVVVGSWQEWKARLRAGGEVWDSYGERVPTEEFIRDVEATNPEARRWQYDWVRDNQWRSPLHTIISQSPRPDAHWLDPDGFTFTGRPFS